MKNAISKVLAFLTVILLVFISFYNLTPHPGDFSEENQLGFSMENANTHIKKISEKPHSIGTQAHSQVRNYIVSELQEMGLQVQTQKGYHFNNSGIFTVPENIIAKIPGSNPQPKNDLMVMSHYDSAVHSSYGASDAASGVAVILETVRAFLESGEEHQNNIIICLTDAEEVGLNGAGLFVKEHAWAKNIGLVLNFEARGSGGPSNTIVETNSGNRSLINSFKEANPSYPLANSLMYSVYKKLPNDTDATVLREEMDIPSFFFAFIDDHYDYHTANDTFENLDQNSLAHQASYLTALLPYYANKNLTELKSEKEVVYFNFPGIGMISYPFGWAIVLVVLGWVVFFGISLYAFRKKRFSPLSFSKSIAWFVVLLFTTGFISFLGIEAVTNIYAQFEENQHGFTRNGQDYIIAFVAFTITLTLFFYYWRYRKENAVKTIVGPLFIWLLLNTAIAIGFQGASYFIWPVLFALASYFLMLKSERPSIWVQLILAVPAIFLLVPLIQFFPVGLGLKMLIISTSLTVLVVGLLLPVFVYLPKKQWIAAGLLTICVGFLWKAHYAAEYSTENPKPNSLLYVLNTDENQAFWATYDHELDEYTSPYFQQKDTLLQDLKFHSKYNLPFNYTNKAPLKNIEAASVLVERDSVFNDSLQNYTLKIAPNRKVNRIELFANKEVNFYNFSANGVEAMNSETSYFSNRKTNKLLTYYAVDRDTLRLNFGIKKRQPVQITIAEASNDLLTNEEFNIQPRDKTMIPKPFVLNDAVITTQKIELNPKK